MTHYAMIIRAATTLDDDALARLATLDRRPPPLGQALLAEADGNLIAAIALTSGAVLADPANPNTAAIHLLRHRRYRLLRQGGDVGHARSVLRRLAPPLAA